MKVMSAQEICENSAYDKEILKHVPEFQRQ